MNDVTKLTRILKQNDFNLDDFKKLHSERHNEGRRDLNDLHVKSAALKSEMMKLYEHLNYLSFGITGAFLALNKQFEINLFLALLGSVLLVGNAVRSYFYLLDWKEHNFTHFDSEHKKFKAVVKEMNDNYNNLIKSPSEDLFEKYKQSTKVFLDYKFTDMPIFKRTYNKMTYFTLFIFGLFLLWLSLINISWSDFCIFIKK